MKKQKLFLSKNIYLENSVISGGILVNNHGKIEEVLNAEDVNEFLKNKENVEVIDVGEYVLMPGIIDSHVHVNEPGRTDWEGFETATKAAAAGGITTIVDMPLNSIPATTSLQNLKTKVNYAKHKVYVDVAFWGGVVPGNQAIVHGQRIGLQVNLPVMKFLYCGATRWERVFTIFTSATALDAQAHGDKVNVKRHLQVSSNLFAWNKANCNELLDMVKFGVVGFKCFLCPSGVCEFNYVNIENVEHALQILENSDAVLAFHAETEENIKVTGDPTEYQTFLNSRPDSMELKAIQHIIELSQKYNVRTHIVHLSTATALPLIEEAKKLAPRLTVETCHHYLNFNSEDIPRKATQFKCCPPIRISKNRESLWEGLKNNIIDMVVSDHSPCTPDLKLLDEGDFMRAWGGISSVQFGLSIFWTECTKRGLTVYDVTKYMTKMPAQLCGLHKYKGKIAKNFHADFVIWDPNGTVTIEESMILHKNKVTPYLGKQLKGKVIKTVLRGEIIYEDDKPFLNPTGKLLIND